MTQSNERAAKRRARRIAADEAHAWARNLRLGNHHGKAVLTDLALYIDGDGYCFVAIPSIADDVELSPDTVRRRLAWLEEIGAIARLPQWIDEYGRRNGDARGKRTSDMIRLLFDADIEAIEARARGETVIVSHEVSPSSQQGLTEQEEPAPEQLSPRPALGQPSHYGQVLNSEPEPESPLRSPLGTGESASQDQESEPEHFAPAWQAWPGHEVMRRDLALAEFRLLSPEKQLQARAAVPLFAQLQVKLGRTRVPNFHLWLRSKGFDEFPNARLAEPAAAPPRHWLDQDQVAGLAVALQMADRPAPRLVDDPERGRGLWRLTPCEPDLRALARFAGADPQTWQIVELGTAQFAAWRDRLVHWLGGEVTGERIWLEDYDPQVHGRPAMDPAFRLRKATKGLRVPTPWPPHRDGTWSEEAAA